MSAFKLKQNRTKQSVQINTLDDIHKKIVASFQSRKHLLPEKENELNNLQKELSILETKGQYTIDDVRKRADYKARIQKLQDDIYDITNDLSELDYYSKTDNIIMDYYEIADNDDFILYDLHPELSNEKKEEIMTNSVDKLDILNQQNNKQCIKKTIKRRKRTPNDEPQHTILDFLTGTSNSVPTENANTPSKPEDKKEETEKQKPEPDKSKNKAELFDQYMSIVDNEYKCSRGRTSNIIRKCENCNIDKTLINSEGIFVCQKCGEVEQIIIDSEKPNYKEAISDTKPGYPLIYGEQSIIMLVIL